MNFVVLTAFRSGLLDPSPYPLSFLETTPKMSKVILSTLVAALVCVAGSAKAANGISTSTLSQMGLSGLAVMSDSDALRHPRPRLQHGHQPQHGHRQLLRPARLGFPLGQGRW